MECKQASNFGQRPANLFLEAASVFAGFDDVAAMVESIEQSNRHFGIAERAASLAERQVRGDDVRKALAELADQVERQRFTFVGERQVTEFIEHDNQQIAQPLASVLGFGHVR